MFAHGVPVWVTGPVHVELGSGSGPAPERAVNAVVGATAFFFFARPSPSGARGGAEHDGQGRSRAPVESRCNAKPWAGKQERPGVIPAFLVAGEKNSCPVLASNRPGAVLPGVKAAYRPCFQYLPPTSMLCGWPSRPRLTSRSWAPGFSAGGYWKCFEWLERCALVVPVLPAFAWPPGTAAAVL